MVSFGQQKLCTLHCRPGCRLDDLISNLGCSSRFYHLAMQPRCQHLRGAAIHPLELERVFAELGMPQPDSIASQLEKVIVTLHRARIDVCWVMISQPDGRDLGNVSLVACWLLPGDRQVLWRGPKIN